MVDVATGTNNRHYNITNHHVCFQEHVGYTVVRLCCRVSRNGASGRWCRLVNVDGAAMLT